MSDSELKFAASIDAAWKDLLSSLAAVTCPGRKASFAQGAA